MLLLEIEKKESKSLTFFQKLLDQTSQNLQYNQSRQSQSSKENIYLRGNSDQQELDIYLEILVPHLNNPFEEVIFGSNEIKEEHEKIKL